MSYADFSGYPEKDRRWLVDQLALVTSELYNALVVYGCSQAQERTARVRGFLSSSETSIAGRERDAEAQALHLTVSLFELDARIKALTEERDLLRLLLDASED